MLLPSGQLVNLVPKILFQIFTYTSSHPWIRLNVGIILCGLAVCFSWISLPLYYYFGNPHTTCHYLQLRYLLFTQEFLTCKLRPLPRVLGDLFRSLRFFWWLNDVNNKTVQGCSWVFKNILQKSTFVPPSLIMKDMSAHHRVIVWSWLSLAWLLLSLLKLCALAFSSLLLNDIHYIHASSSSSLFSSESSPFVSPPKHHKSLNNPMFSELFTPWNFHHKNPALFSHQSIKLLHKSMVGPFVYFNPNDVPHHIFFSIW